MKMFKMSTTRRSMLVIAIAVAFLWYLTSTKNNYKMYYTANEANPVVISGAAAEDQGFAPANVDATETDLGQMNAGTGLASSLLPREMSSQEDFGQFAPDDILKGQNFLEPRAQIGWPETIGGNLRNANKQVRAEPPNPKQPYTWNNSTIVPDLMQRKICT